MTRLLLVEDHQTLCDSLSRYLRGEGYQVTVATKLSDARAQLCETPEAIILDWMLPDGQGIDFLRELRGYDDRTPVILLTAKVDLVDKVVGLEMGASDYLTKPFEPRELLARLRAQLRIFHTLPPREGPAESANPGGHGTGHGPGIPLEPRYEHGNLCLDPNTRKVFLAGREVCLTRMEYELLRFFLANPGRVFSREALLNRVWGYEDYQTTRTVDNHIAALRQKLGPQSFETARGAGYRLAPAREGAENGDVR